MIKAKKSLGQNFLQDKAVILNIINQLPQSSDVPILEIGPGLGALTKWLDNRYTQLTVVEFDHRLSQQLILQYPSVTVIEGDFLTLDLSALLMGKSWHIIGNLPYNIGTEIVLKCIQYRNQIQEMVVMLQKEVVDRMLAEASSSNRGRLSILIQRYCDVTFVQEVLPESFSPAPKVKSSVIKLSFHDRYQGKILSESLFETIIKVAFQGRRKTLGKTLKSYLTVVDWLELSIDSKLRPQDLSIQSWIDIANFICNKQK